MSWMRHLFELLVGCDHQVEEARHEAQASLERQQQQVDRLEVMVREMREQEDGRSHGHRA
jgi:hypothetical protein